MGLNCDILQNALEIKFVMFSSVKFFIYWESLCLHLCIKNFNRIVFTDNIYSKLTVYILYIVSGKINVYCLSQPPVVLLINSHLSVFALRSACQAISQSSRSYQHMEL